MSVQGFAALPAAKGGRNGHTETADGVIRADLSVPKESGGPGEPGLATPEHLFAAGYAACFGGPSYARAILTTEEWLALLAAAREKKHDNERSRSLENATL